MQSSSSASPASEPSSPAKASTTTCSRAASSAKRCGSTRATTRRSPTIQRTRRPRPRATRWRAGWNTIPATPGSSSTTSTTAIARAPSSMWMRRWALAPRMSSWPGPMSTGSSRLRPIAADLLAVCDEGLQPIPGIEEIRIEEPAGLGRLLRGLPPGLDRPLQNAQPAAGIDRLVVEIDDLGEAVGGPEADRPERVPVVSDLDARSILTVRIDELRRYLGEVAGDRAHRRVLRLRLRDQHAVLAVLQPVERHPAAELGVEGEAGIAGEERGQDRIVLLRPFLDADRPRPAEHENDDRHRGAGTQHHQDQQRHPHRLPRTGRPKPPARIAPLPRAGLPIGRRRRTSPRP